MNIPDIIKRLSAPMMPQPTQVAPRLGSLKNVKAVIFDVYGTLFISGSGDIGVARASNNAATLTAALTEAGFTGDMQPAGVQGVELMNQTIVAHHQRQRQATGTSSPEVDIREVWRDVCQKLENNGLLADTENLDAKIPMLAVSYECRVNPVWPMPAAAATLARLQAKVKLGIVSNAQFYTPLLFTALLDANVEKSGFTPSLCTWSYEIRRSKPDIAMFEQVIKNLARLNIAPEETAYVGNDMLNDIYTARQAGLKTILFAGDKRSLRLRKKDERCSSLKPDYIITELQQLIGMLEKQ